MGRLSRPPGAAPGGLVDGGGGGSASPFSRKPNDNGESLGEKDAFETTAVGFSSSHMAPGHFSMNGAAPGLEPAPFEPKMALAKTPRHRGIWR